MCGLLGVAGNLYSKDTDVFKDLFYASSVRGEDGAGIAHWRKSNHNFQLYKSAWPSYHLLDSKRINGIINCSADVLMGHTRKATDYTGDPEMNAHPFAFEHIVGAHNGMLRYDARMKFPHKKPTYIDSAELLYNIAQESLEDIIPLIWGAWALSILDRENKTLSFLRNKERPLNIMFADDGKQMYWASEGAMLKWILDRHNVKTSTEQPIALESDTIYRFDLKESDLRKGMKEVKCAGGEEPGKKYQSSTGGTTHHMGGTTHQHHTGHRGSHRTDAQRLLLEDQRRGGARRRASGTQFGQTTGRGALTTAQSSTRTQDSHTTRPAIRPAVQVMMGSQDLTALSVEELGLKLYKAKMKLLEFNYSRWIKWSKNQKDRWASILNNCERYEEALFFVKQALIEEETIERLGVTKHMLLTRFEQEGCAYCSTNVIDESQIDKCEITSSRDVICPECAENPSVRMLIGLPEIIEQVN